MDEEELAEKEAGRIAKLVARLKNLKKEDADISDKEPKTEEADTPEERTTPAPVVRTIRRRPVPIPPREDPVETRPYIAPRQSKVTFRSLNFADFLLLLLILVVHVLDWNQSFQRSPVQISSFFAMYTVIALLCAAIIRYEGEDFWHAFLHKYFMYALIAVLWPRLLGFAFNLVPTFGDTMVQGLTLLEFLFIIATYFPIFIILIYSKSRSYFSKFVKFYYVGSIVVIAIFIVAGNLQEIPGGTGVVFAGNEGAEKYWDFMKDSFEQFFKDLAGFPTAIQTGLNQTMNRYTESYFTGEVEQNQREKLGVFLENLKPITDPVLPGDPEIVVIGTINARTFKGNIRIHNSCYATFRPDDGTKNPAETTIQGIVDIPDLDIHNYESNQLICTIDRSQVRTKDRAITINFTSQFNFVTWAYMDLVWMDRTVLFYSADAGGNALKQVGLSDQVKSTATPGPVKVGLKDTKTPMTLPIGLDKTNPVPPLFGATLENGDDYIRRGRMIKINKLVYHVPKYMFLRQESCTPVHYSGEEQTPDNIFTLYTFPEVPIREGAREQTIACRLGIEPDDIPVFLGNGGIAFTTFSVEADYIYELSESIQVRIEPDLIT